METHVHATEGDRARLRHLVSPDATAADVRTVLGLAAAHPVHSPPAERVGMAWAGCLAVGGGEVGPG